MPGVGPLCQVKVIGGNSARAGIAHVMISHRGKETRLMPDDFASTRTTGGGCLGDSESQSSWTFNAMNARFAVWEAQLPSWHVPKSRHRLRCSHA